MNMTDHLNSMRAELRAIFVVMLLSLVAASALLLWGILSSQSFVVMLGASIALVSLVGWGLERSGVKQNMRGLA